MAFLDFFRSRSAEKTTAKQAADAKRRALAPGAKATRNLLQAANVSRLEQSWTTTPHTADTYICQNWTTLVARARDARHNNEHAKKFLQLVKDNVAGPTGFRFHADVRDPNGKVDKLASDALELGFKAFSRKGNFDVTGMLSRADVERLWCDSLATDGEAICVLRYGAKAGPYGFAVQMMDPLFLDPNHNEDFGPDKNFIRHSIEFTPEGRPVAYHFRKYDEVLPSYTQYVTGKYDRIDAEFVVHDFLTEMIGQKRGLSHMRAALWRMRMLKGYEDAAVTNARVGAAKMGFFRDPEGEIVEEEDLPMDAEPGTFANIGGLEFEKFDPQYPSGDFAPFTKRCLMTLAAGLGPAYHNLASDMEGVNYSSARVAELAEREIWKGLQAHVIGSFCERIYFAWIDYILLAEKVTINGKPLRVASAERYKDAGQFTGRRWDWVDPMKSVAAAEAAIRLGIESRQSVMREKGKEPWEVWDQLEEERAEMEKRGIPTDDPKHISAQAAADAAANSDAGNSQN